MDDAQKVNYTKNTEHYINIYKKTLLTVCLNYFSQEILKSHFLSLKVMPYNFDLIRKTKQEKHRAKQIKEGTPTLCDKEDDPISVYGAGARKYKQEYILG